MQAIKTIYKGVKYRSFLEAKMAYILDKLNINFEYETVRFDRLIISPTYDIGSHNGNSRQTIPLQIVKSYTPDFYLPELQVIIEMKGEYDQRSKENTKIIEDFNTDFYKTIIHRQDYLHEFTYSTSIIKSYLNKIPQEISNFLYLVIDSNLNIIECVHNYHQKFQYTINQILSVDLYKDITIQTSETSTEDSWECLKFSTPAELVDYLNNNNIKKEDVLISTENSKGITLVYKSDSLVQTALEDTTQLILPSSERALKVIQQYNIQISF